MEAHSGLSALIAQNARGPNGEAFHAVWSSSLTSSAIKGKPDIETVDTTARGQGGCALSTNKKNVLCPHC